MVCVRKSGERTMNIEQDILHLEENINSLAEKKILLKTSLLLIPNRYFIQRYKIKKKITKLNSKLSSLNNKLSDLNYKLNRLRFYRSIEETIDYVLRLYLGK